MRILFQGDSITDAHRMPQEVNPAFQLGAGYVLMVAAELAVRWPGSGWKFVNRGVSGNRLADLRKRWEADALEVRPDVLSLLAGVNDTYHFFQHRVKADEGQIADDYRYLLESSLQVNPDLKLIMMEPFVLECGVADRRWRDHLAPRQQAIAGLAAEYGAEFLPLQSVFDEASESAPPEYWAYDGVHPTHAGFRLIADAWLACAEESFLSGPQLLAAR